jgi:2-oxoglutarate ferredoxin oxidoreductase subunit gamma
VKPHPVRGQIKQYAIAATRIAEKLGNRLYSNFVMIGFIVAVTKVMPKQAVLDSIPGTVPDRLLQKNIDAFEQGFAVGEQQLAAAK